jgi:hypothetical protein
MITPVAWMLRLHPISFASITVFAAVMVHGPV